MKATAKSDFHPGLQITFTGLEEGVNIRQLRGKRDRYCLDYSNNNSHACGCGFPTRRTTWSLPDGCYIVREAEECGLGGKEYGRGYLRIEIAQMGVI